MHIYIFMCIYTQGFFCLFVVWLLFFFPKMMLSLQDQGQYQLCQFEEEQGAGFPIAQLEQFSVSAKIYAAKLMQTADTGRKGCLTAWETDRKPYGILTKKYTFPTVFQPVNIFYHNSLIRTFSAYMNARHNPQFMNRPVLNCISKYSHNICLKSLQIQSDYCSSINLLKTNL